MVMSTLLVLIKFVCLKGVRARKIPRFSFSIEERGVLGE